jgi:hypothetical protein
MDFDVHSSMMAIGCEVSSNGFFSGCFVSGIGWWCFFALLDISGSFDILEVHFESLSNVVAGLSHILE